MHLRGLFSVRRIRRRSWTTAAGHDIAPCFLLHFLHCNALSAFFSSVVWTNSSGILRAFFPRKWSSVVGSPSLLHSNAFFCLRGACAQLAREMQLNFSVLELLDWHILKPLLLENKQHIQRKALMIKSIYIQCMRVYIYIVCKWYISW